MRNKKTARANKIWTEEEDFKLENLWGKYNIKVIMKELGRSQRSIEHRAIKLKLGSFFDNGLYTATDVSNLIGIDIGAVIRWINNKGLKARKKTRNKQQNYQIVPENLYEWLKENQDLWSSANLEPMALGKEEDWLIKKRVEDKKHLGKYKRYTKEEINIIKKMYLQGYTDIEISEKLKRPLFGVKHKISQIRKEENLPFKNSKSQMEKAS